MPYSYSAIRHTWKFEKSDLLSEAENAKRIKGHVLTVKKNSDGSSVVRRVGDATTGINGVKIDLYSPPKIKSVC